MPNGRPGDNPITDVTEWNLTVFGPETDALISEIAAFTTDYGAYDPFEDVAQAPVVDEPLAVRVGGSTDCSSPVLASPSTRRSPAASLSHRARSAWSRLASTTTELVPPGLYAVPIIRCG
jgi:hypothetical protein